jgi:hypothetical protein
MFLFFSSIFLRLLLYLYRFIPSGTGHVPQSTNA